MPAVNGFIDMYLANRTTTGWVTTFPNLKGSETAKEWGFSCSESMDLCVSHIGELQALNEETGQIETFLPQNSPYLYKADGTRITRLPTNVNTVPGGINFKGDQMLSGDFSHFVFSTRTPFVPGRPTTEAQGPSTTTTSPTKRSRSSRSCPAVAKSRSWSTTTNGRPASPGSRRTARTS